MADIKKFDHINSLLLTYGDLLSKIQKDVLTCYYSYNLSLGEIASERNISRAAVDDALKKGENKLEEIEKALKINEKREKILKITAKIKQNYPDTEIDIEDIERILTDGI